MGRKTSIKAFALAEIVVAIAVLGIVAAIVLSTVSDYKTGGERIKLENDIAALNRCVSSYLSNGGNLDSVTDLEAVISKLKTEAASAQAYQVVGLRGSFLDLRVKAVMQTAAEALTSEPRGVWNGTVQRFQLATSGVGAKKFILSQGSAVVTEEVRDIRLKHGTVKNWVWDYEDAALPGRPSFTVVPTTPHLSPTASVAPSAGSKILQAPVFSSAGGSYPFSDFDLTVTLSDPNPPGASQIAVSIDGGPFEIYSSAAICVAPGSSIAAYGVTADPDNWSDSATITNTYEIAPVQLDISFEVPQLSVNYADVGGAMVPGMVPAPIAKPPGSVTLDNAAQIPMKYQNDSVFTIDWTYDGADPATAITKLSANSFSGGFSGQSIDYSLSQWNSLSTLPIQAVAKSRNTALVTDSPVISRVLSIDPIPLRTPEITIGSTSITIAPVTDFGDLPVGARILYTLDGTPPGDLNGVPTSGTLYKGPIPLASAKGKQINARVYAPDSFEHWFVTSAVASETNHVKYGDIKLALLIDESGSIDAIEAAEIRAGLTQFFNDELNSGNMISVIGMSKSNNDSRSDHVGESPLTPVTKSAFDTWVNDYRFGRVSIQADYWASALEVASINTELDLAVIIGDGIQGSTVKSANYVSQMRANGTHVFFIGIDPGEYIYSKGTIASSPSTAIDAVLGSEATASSQADLSDLLSTDYATRPTFSDLGITLSNMTNSLKAAFGL